MPPRHVKTAPVKIMQRWHFSSQLKRMAVIGAYQQTNAANQLESIHIACVKGAAETVKTMVGHCQLVEIGH
jgi:magnesium-transporting ATPase (P-type)